MADRAPEERAADQPSITAYLWEQFQRNGMKAQHLEIANEFLGQDIQAGLIPGEMNLLEHEIEWLAGLLQTHDFSRELLPKYLTLNKQAIEVNLNRRRQPVLDWFNSILSKS